MARLHLRHLLWRPLGDQLATTITTIWPEVNHPVGGLDHIKVVLDHDDAISAVNESVQHLKEALNIGEVQASGRLIKDVRRATGGATRKFGRELDALRLATRERGSWLTKAQIAEAHLAQGLETIADGRDRIKALQCIFNLQIKDVRDRHPLPGDIERLAVVALTAAGFAGDIDVWEELHLDLKDAVA